MSRAALDALLTVTAAMPMPPRPRIIVGVPGIDENTWCDAPDNLYLVGEVAWRKLQTFIQTADEADEDLPAARAMLVGVPVEHYDPTNPRHSEVALRVMMARDEGTEVTLLSPTREEV